jgi:hypothetical protein
MSFTSINPITAIMIHKRTTALRIISSTIFFFHLIISSLNLCVYGSFVQLSNVEIIGRMR